MDKITSTLRELSLQGKLSGDYDITPELILTYREIYARFGNGKERGNSKHNSKLAAMNLLKHKVKVNGIKPKDLKEGWIYAITNPAWPTLVKIGRTYDLHKRISQLNTASPHRDYVVQYYRFCSTVSSVEREIHKKLGKYHVQGEWFEVPTEVLLEILAGVA